MIKNTKDTFQVFRMLGELGRGLADFLQKNPEYRPKQHDGTGFRWTEAEINAVRQGSSADGGSQG